jgi:hypothetical protein
MGRKRMLSGRLFAILGFLLLCEMSAVAAPDRQSFISPLELRSPQGIRDARLQTKSEDFGYMPDLRSKPLHRISNSDKG